MSCRASRNNSGFTLVEVLVALVVLSIGMLGMAALFLEGLRSSRSALVRSQAVLLAADMGDRIRANRYIAAGSLVYDPVTTIAAANNTCDRSAVATSICTAQQMYANDLARWQADVQSRLPDGTGVVGFQVVNGIPTYTVTITWTEPGNMQGSYELTVQA